jgi:translocation and assembly module TamB
MRVMLIWILCALTPLTALAQSGDDRSFLTAFLEDNLSDLGRTVRVTGFQGALSSRATFESLTIADGDGVWITIRNGAIRWNRSALLQRRIEIEELTADEIDLPRAPKGKETANRGAREFVLPELPVAVRIGTIRAGRVTLGTALLGKTAVVSLDGSMQLEGGEGEAALTIDRLDDAKGNLTLTAAYANATRQLRLDFLATEGAGGIAASLLGIPGQPPVSLAVRAAGPIDDVLAEVSLSSDGVSRLTGQVKFLASADSEGAEPERRFRADIKGDIAPLLLPDYRTFFGDSLTLAAEGRRTTDGRFDLSEFRLDSRAIRISGSAVVLADGLPQRADLAVSWGLDDVTPVVLPIPGQRTTVTGGDLTIGFDASKGDGWTLDGRLSGFQRPGLRLATLRLDGSGRIARAAAGTAARNTSAERWLSPQAVSRSRIAGFNQPQVPF